MRHRALDDKRAITQRFCHKWLPLLAERKIYPIIDSLSPNPATYFLAYVPRTSSVTQARQQFGGIGKAYKRN